MMNNKKTVLIVEDQDPWRMLLKELLEEDFEVTIVRDYDEALKAISTRSSPFSVVVTDMRLIDSNVRNEDGLRLAEYIRHRKNSTKVIVLTGYPTIHSAIRAAGELHVFKYLEKYPENGEGFDHREFQRIVKVAAIQAEGKRQNKLYPTDQLDVFMVMPFAKKYRTFYDDVIKKTIEEMGMVCKRADDFFQSKVIMDDILYCIKNAKLILADFSGRSPNVFFEVGIAHALGKSTVLLAQDINDIPPKLRTIRNHIYQNNLIGAKEFPGILRTAIQQVAEHGFPAFYSHKKNKTDPQTCIALLPSNQHGDMTYNELIADLIKELGLHCTRAEKLFDPRSILKQTWQKISSSSLVIADLTDRDPDVFYLAGLAFGLKKPIIYLAQQDVDIPFDLKDGSALIYSLADYDRGKTAKETLSNILRALVA